MKPLVSVIVPNCNGAEHLTERIETILAQTYKNIEVILLDDGSTDVSLHIMDEYVGNDKVQKILANPQQSGNALDQWAKGLAHAKGEFIWIAQSASTSDKKFLEKMVKCITRKPNTVMAFCRSMQIDEQGTELGIAVQQKRMSSRFHMSGYEFIGRYLSRSNRIIDSSSVIFRREAVQFIDTQYRLYTQLGDWLFWLELAEKGMVSFMPKPLNKFRTCSTTSASLPSTEAGIREEMRLFNYLRSKGSIDDRRLNRVKVNSIYRVKYVLGFDDATRKALLEEIGSNFGLSVRAFIKKMITRKKANS